MPRPTKLPTWATTSPHVLEPSDGKKAAGWVPGEQPPAAFFNYWQNLVHEWVTWLDESSLSDGAPATVGNLQVNGTLGTTGLTTIGTDGDGASLQVNGSITTTGGVAVGVAGTPANLDVTGNADVLGGDFRVLAGDAKISGLYAYVTPPTRTKAISVAQGGGSSVHGQYAEIGPGAERVYVVDAPHGATLGAVRIKVLAFSVGPGNSVHYTVRLMQRRAIDFTSTGVPNHAQIDTDTETLTPGPSAVNRTRSFANLAVSKDETYEIALLCESDSGAGCVLRVLAIDYSFVDPGPRNH